MRQDENRCHDFLRDPGSRCPIGTNLASRPAPGNRFHLRGALGRLHQASLALLDPLAEGAKGGVHVALDVVAGWPGPGIAQTGSAKGFMDPAGQRPVTQEALDVDIPHAGQVVPSRFKALTKQDGSKHARGSRCAMTATDTVEEHILTSPQRIAQKRKQVTPLLVSPIRVGDGKLAFRVAPCKQTPPRCEGSSSIHATCQQAPSPKLHRHRKLVRRMPY